MDSETTARLVQAQAQVDSRAACRNRDDVDFFPEDATPEGHDPDYGPALEVCYGCPVIDACLENALEFNLDSGVLGGTTPAQRKAMQRHWKTVPHGTVRGYNTFKCRCTPCSDSMTVYFQDRRHPIDGAVGVDGHHKKSG